MVRRAMVVLCVGFMCFFVAGCGQSYKLDSIVVTPGAPTASGVSEINLEGEGAFQQLTVTAKFSNNKSVDVTSKSTFAIGPSPINDPFPGCENTHTCIAPLESLRVTNTGLVSVIGKACTWDTEPTNVADTTFGYGVSPYPMTVTYTENGVTATANMDIDVANLAFSCFDGKLYVPPAGFMGNSVVGY